MMAMAATIGGIVVVVLVLVLVAVIVSASTPPGTASGQAAGSDDVCFTYCMGVVEMQCGDNEILGPCFGIWDCRAEIGAHECK